MFTEIVVWMWKKECGNQFSSPETLHACSAPLYNIQKTIKEGGDCDKKFQSNS